MFREGDIVRAKKDAPRRYTSTTDKVLCVVLDSSYVMGMRVKIIDNPRKGETYVVNPRHFYSVSMLEYVKLLK